MAAWSTKRQLFYGASVLLIVALISAAAVFVVLHRAPTCSDGKQNGLETGIDCGGGCQKICKSDALTPIVLWSKVFNISGDVYTAVANIQNPNVNSKNAKATYNFKIYDQNDGVIAEKSGQTSIPKNKTFAVFEPGLVISGAVPKLVEFTFTSFSDWQKDFSAEPQVNLSYLPLSSASTSPRIQGSVSNTSLVDAPHLELDAFVLDNNENVIGASRTFIDNLRKRTSQDFFFTWPKPFPLDPSMITVTYRAL